MGRLEVGGGYFKSACAWGGGGGTLTLSSCRCLRSNGSGFRGLGWWSSSRVSVAGDCGVGRMGREEVLRRSLVSLGAAVFLVGLCTFSFKKMVATYIFGILAVCGILLPDWEFFDRDFSQWFTPMPADSHTGPAGPFDQTSRFGTSPILFDVFSSHECDTAGLGMITPSTLRGIISEKLELILEPSSGGMNPSLG